MSGTAARALRSPQLLRLVRQAWDGQRRFPLQLATVLSHQFAGHGLQFFKVNKTITHVSVARPHYLDLEATPVSEGVRRIVECINANPKTTRRRLVEALAPTPAVPAEQSTPGVTAAPPESPAATPEQTAVNADLHWLIHQGHVIEFANGTLETAKKPLPRPPKPEAKTQESPAESGAASPELEAPIVPTDQTNPPEVNPYSPEPMAEPLREEPSSIERKDETPAGSEAAPALEQEFRRHTDPPAATGEHHATEPPVPEEAARAAHPE